MVSVESTESKKGYEETACSESFDVRLVGFLDFVTDLQKQGLLDGEVLITRGGQILLNLQNKEINSVDEGNERQFMIGSVSKQFFAAALLKSLYDSSDYPTTEQKVEDVKRRLHHPISDFLPEKATIWNGNMPSWAGEVSLHHLLTHTSGIPNYTDSQGYRCPNSLDKKLYWLETYHKPSEIIDLISKEPLLFPPGSKFSYCNTGYVIITEVIETITSLSASEYVQQILFDSLGLSSTISPRQGKWNELKCNQKLSRLVAPFQYDLRGDHIALYPQLHCEDISIAQGCGSIISSSADLVKWNQLLHKEKSVLPLELYNLMITPNINGYGYGIVIENNYTGVLYGHDGKIGSYRTRLFYMPKYDISILMLSNIDYDFDKIEDEFNAAMADFKDTIPDKIERRQAALKIVLKKYPFKRGFQMITKEFSKLIR